MPVIQTVIELPYPHALGLHATVWQVGSYRGGFWFEIFPMFKRAKASWLQDGPTIGQGQAHQ